MKRNNILKMSLSFGLLSSMLVGCSTSQTTSSVTEVSVVEDDSEVTATINLWASEDGEWLDTELKAFQKIHPKWDLTFETTVVSEDEVASKALTDVDSVADVYFYNNDEIPTLVSSSVLAELGGDTLTTIQNNNDQTIVSTVTYNSAVYGIPYTTDTYVLYYDKTVFSKDDVKNLDTMLEKGKVGISLTDYDILASFYAGNGCTLSNTIDFSGDKATNVTNYLVDLVSNKNFVKVDTTSVDLLTNGKVNAIFGDSSDYEAVKEALGEDNVGIAIAPKYTLNGSEIQLKPLVSSSAIGVNPNSENLKVAVSLANFLASSSSQQDHFDIDGVIPTDTTLDVSEIRIAKIHTNTVKNIGVAIPAKDMTNCWTAAQTMGSEIVNGTVTHDNASEKTEAMNVSMNVTSE